MRFSAPRPSALRRPRRCSPRSAAGSSPLTLLPRRLRRLPAVPSREAIATAYQAALQTQAPAAVPAEAAIVAPPPAAPVKTLDADTLAGLMTRAKSLMAVGDIAAARLLLVMRSLLLLPETGLGTRLAVPPPLPDLPQHTLWRHGSVRNS